MRRISLVVVLSLLWQILPATQAIQPTCENTKTNPFGEQVMVQGIVELLSLDQGHFKIEEVELYTPSERKNPVFLELMRLKDHYASISAIRGRLVEIGESNLLGFQMTQSKTGLTFNFETGSISLMTENPCFADRFSAFAGVPPSSIILRAIVPAT